MKSYERFKKQGKWISGTSMILFAFCTFMAVNLTIVFLPLILGMIGGFGCWCVGKAKEIDFKTGVEHGSE